MGDKSGLRPFGKLAALKAVLLGYGARATEICQRDAMRMVDTALRTLRYVRKPERRLQLAFYHLVRAEIRTRA